MPARDVEPQVEEGMRFARSRGTIVQISGLGKLQRADPGIGALVRRSGNARPERPRNWLLEQIAVKWSRFTAPVILKCHPREGGDRVTPAMLRSTGSPPSRGRQALV